MTGEKPDFEVEPVGDHEYLVQVRGTEEHVEAWVRVTPGVFDGLAMDEIEEIEEIDEITLVRRTIAFLVRHQDAADFPAIVEIEDVLASYPDYRNALTG